MSEGTKSPGSDDEPTQPTVRGDDPTTPDAGTVADTRAARSAPDTEAPTPDYEDLSGDSLLRGLPRIRVEGRETPSLHGIQIVRKLGQGAMGAVYLAYKPMLRQYVAVKVLPMHLAELNPQLVERFIREAQLAASIESPHLIRVTDVNESEGLFFLVMEFVDGVSAGALLRSLRDSGRHLDEASALEICIAAGTGLAAAHARGIIHRDLKPDNILVPRPDASEPPAFGRAKLADLGLARRDALGQSLTSTDMGMGTAGYMAPEQALSARTAGKQADVFGLGATLYALLASRPPFTGGSVTEIIVKTLQEPHTPIRDLRPDVSEPTAALLDRCLSKDPAGRFVDASALVEALLACREALSDRVSSTDALARLVTISHATEVGEKLKTPSLSSADTDGSMTVATDISDAATVVGPSPTLAGVGDADSSPSGRRRRALAAAAILVVALVATIVFFGLRGRKGKDGSVVPAMATVEVPLTTSADRQRWIEWAATEFAGTDEGRGVRVVVNALPGLAAEREMLDTGELPLLLLMTNNLTEERFATEWKERQGVDPVARREVVSLSPQVFAMFENRYEQFVRHYGKLDFANIGDAFTRRRWAAIGGPESWGPFTFALSDRTSSLNGIAAAALAAYQATGMDESLTIEDVRSPRARELLARLDLAFGTGGGGSEIMRELLLKGPSQYDGVCAAESSVIEYLESAEDRWGPIRVVYPEVNLWNESTVYLMNRAQATPAEREAANRFIDFLIGGLAQQKLAELGFRPIDPDVRLHFEGSPFTRLRDRGIGTEVPIVLKTPSEDVIVALATR